MTKITLTGTENVNYTHSTIWVSREQTMRFAANLIKRLRHDEDGASLIEYTVLLAILLIAVIGIITAVGVWINGKWAALNSALP